MARGKPKSIRQTARFKAAPHAVYEALMDSRQHGEFTGGKARISRKEGGRFSVYDGYASGKNLKLVPDREIVQTWRADDWPAGHFSRISFKLTRTRTGTKLVFAQTGVPAKQYADIKQGWIDFYWKPMKELLEL